MDSAPDPRAVRPALSESASATALLLLAVACAGFLFAQERAVAPVELPSLVLPAADVRHVIARDLTLAARPVTPAIVAIEALLAAQGIAEAKVLEEFAPYQERRAMLTNACAALADKGGAGPAMLRARAVERLQDALGLRLPDAEIPGVLGSFARTLEREGVTRDAEIVAPMFVVRTLYKARENLLCGYKPDAGFERVERLAYYGWQSLHAERLPPAQRLAALDRYAEAGGKNVEEARGALLFRSGDASGAATTLAEAYARSGSLRVRNHVLGAQRERAQVVTGP